MTKIPEFKTLEEEKQYWENYFPDAIKKGRLHRANTEEKHMSILRVSLTGQELTQLSEVAGLVGLGPSSFARLLIVGVLK